MPRLLPAALLLAPLALAACQDMRGTSPMTSTGTTPSDTATSQAARSGSGMQGAGAASATPAATEGTMATPAAPTRRRR